MGNNCCTTKLDVKTKWFHEFEKTLPDLTGKRVAITGTTTGTGHLAAMTCLKKGAEVFMLNRESERSRDALQNIQRAYPGMKVVQISCDLQDFASVRAAAQQLQIACEGRLDVLANNAGIMAVPDAPTKDGYCVQMQTNHISHFLLTKLMLPALQAAAAQNGEARIVNHSSTIRKGEPFNESTMKYIEKKGGQIGGGTLDRYHFSKLAQMLFTYELADRLVNENVKAVVCTPGVAATDLGRHNPCFVRTCSCLLASQVQSAEDGTMGLLSCIALPDIKSGDFLKPNGKEEMTGPLMTLRRPDVEPECQDKESQKLFWAASEKAVSEQFII